MKQTVKNKGALLRVFACVWAMLALVLTCAAPAFADGTASQHNKDIVVSGVEGSTAATAYKVIDIKWDDSVDGGQPVDPMYTWDSNVAAWLKASDNADFKAFTDANGGVTDAYNTYMKKAENKKAFSEALQLAVRTGVIGGLTSTDVTVADNASTLTFEKLPMGGYLISVVGSKMVYEPLLQNVAPEHKDGAWAFEGGSVEAKEKSSDVTFDKGIVKGDGLVNTATGSIGGTVTFRLTAGVPSYPDNAIATQFEMQDKLSAGLTYKGNMVVKAGETVLTEGDQYTLSVAADRDADGKQLVTITFDYSKIKGASKVTVDYDATINGNAIVGKDGNPNEADLIYSNDPYNKLDHRTLHDEVTVYTFGIEVYKRDKAAQDTLLSGAVFSVKDENGKALEFVNIGDGQYRMATDEDAADAKTAELEVGKSGEMLGKLDIKGFDEGKYSLEEVKAPAGYMRLGKPVDVKLVALKDGVDYNGRVDGDSDAKIGYVHEDVLNGKGWNLPTTGDAGIFALIAAGIMLVGGGIMVVRGRRAE